MQVARKVWPDSILQTPPAHLNLQAAVRQVEAEATARANNGGSDSAGELVGSLPEGEQGAVLGGRKKMTAFRTVVRRFRRRRADDSDYPVYD